MSIFDVNHSTLRFLTREDLPPFRNSWKPTTERVEGFYTPGDGARPSRVALTDAGFDEPWNGPDRNRRVEFLTLEFLAG